ncbi:DE-cadherin isoform X2 [Phymastichus coffea]|uniref:DE-cadherin isoform X2 n=1 Tax=Phymastichus coffea TaxID=108790 RepID=UPI00273B6898|nr:DE-cadherin isoform X2 [Phymastichus coffea]
MAAAVRWRCSLGGEDRSWARSARCCWARPRTMVTQAVLLLVLMFASTTIADLPKIRHSRHLDSKSSYRNPEVLKQLQQRNSENHNHKPVFSNCSRYAPVVKEEELPGTFVIQVQAEDRDPSEEGGTITYSFVTANGEKLKFDINNQTGLIRTTHAHDRDEPAREKEVYLTVLATDNGRPQLDDVCTFKVTIEDINDNAPVFDKVSYMESVPQDLSIGREVMRVSATDIDDGPNSKVQYSISPKRFEDSIYFRIDVNTGVIFLNHTIDKTPGYRFSMTAMARDQGDEPKQNVIDIDIRVVESHKKAPTFTYCPDEAIKLPENFSDYEASIARLEAASNIDDSPDYFLFELVTGRTEQTNKENTFRLVSNKNTAEIKLAKSLDYESNTEYSLIVRVQNKYQLAAETMIYIEVLDVNDNIPVFREMKKGSVLENEPPGTPVMQVRAIDADGTSAHNQVTYALGNYDKFFTIDRYTGNITTLVEFDRETDYTYTVKVIATDNSPSALFKTGEHNKGEQNFRIEIADKNDNPPHFTQHEYTANAISEDANINALVTEVKALDADTASPVIYSILFGNVDDSFMIENTTGRIRVNQRLDYEKITQYNLTVRAFDGVFDDTATVRIFIENVNDNQPIFEVYDRNPIIEEEKLYKGCLTTITAYDPDIKDRKADQHIVYSILRPEHKPLIHIDKDGCMMLKKPLDRDPPRGYPVWTISVIAQDEDGGPNSLRNTDSINITLTDINDNAPFLDMPYPVIWRENQGPGNITQLQARDYDSDKNGPPFIYRIDISADYEILTKFEIRGNDLWAKVEFDREERKSYNIPVAITDHGTPSLTGISILTVLIGDENDNPMQDGSSSIFVYNYNGESTIVDIGRVYVNDPDDWDLENKTFSWYENRDVEGFLLEKSTGLITLLHDIRNGTFLLKFTVVEESSKIRRHQVQATVNVTVKEIPKEAVVKSGSIRFLGISAEDLIAPSGVGISKKDLLQEHLSTMFNTSVENVDVFTVLHSPYQNDSVLDVRFSAHGSPYYAAEKLNTIVADHTQEIADSMGAHVLLVNIDECLFEKVHCNSSCRSYLNISSTPYVVYTNASSFVGVRAVVDPQCICHVVEPIECLNGGTPLDTRCECLPGYEGPRCELLSIGFQGDGWAIMPPPGQACDESYLSLEITPHAKDGLIFYFGPMIYSEKLGVQDFMSLELQNGNPVLYMDYGQGTVMLDRSKSSSENNEVGGDQIFIADGKPHRIDIWWSKTNIEMKIDGCVQSSCMRLEAPRGTAEILNVNSPVQIGGAQKDLVDLGEKFKWQHVPTTKGFVGCIRNMTINGNTYNLGIPTLAHNADSGCSTGMAKAVSFGIDTNFLVAILVCITILLILLLAVVVHRRKTDDLYKDMDDIRENIINYEDEGGGEVDTGYDLNVLRAMYDPPNDMKINAASLQGRENDEVPDICGFLDGKKECCDKDPDTNPFDDVRHYAYEGEGNSEGSLSSLASCTDDGDLKFNYLSNFGPRFRKLADMYGEVPSDEESEGAVDRESESWC